MVTPNLQRFDAIVLGAGYTGPLLAAVLGGQGYRVALVETAPLPRVAIGESSTPEQTRMHAWMARRWGVPELLPLSSYYRMKRSRLPLAVWPKESFYFLAHPTAIQPHEVPAGRPAEVLYQTPPWPTGPDMHLFRADTDGYLLSVALRHGATLFGMAQVEEVDLGGPVRLRLVHDGREATLEAPIVFDASGFGSRLAHDLDLRVQDPPEISLRSRTVYNHFVGTRRLEETHGRDWPRLPVPRDHATVHYVWPEGWCWFIPFDNGITSVGILVNQELEGCAEPEKDSAAEFWRRGNTHPGFAATMADARAIRPWTSTGRLQWRTKQVLGDNWILLPPSSGFTDPLFSAGMAMSAVAVARIAEHSDDILRSRRAPRSVLPDYESFFFREIEYIARIQHLFYLAATDFGLLCAALEVYRLGTFIGGVSSGVAGVHPFVQPLWGAGHPRFRQLVDAAHALLFQCRFKGGDTRAATAALRALTKEHDAWGFTASRLNLPVIPNIHLLPALPTLRLVSSMRVGAGWLGMILGAMTAGWPSVARGEASAAFDRAPRRGDLLRLVARDLRILLGR